MIVYWENERQYFPNTACLYYRQTLNGERNSLNLTQVESFKNGTRSETPYKLKFYSTNNEIDLIDKDGTGNVLIYIYL